VPRYPDHARVAGARDGEEEVIAAMPFTCSICGEESTRICARCTKDTCNNHLCEKCLRCSDCCECELTLRETVHAGDAGSARAALRAVAGGPKPEPDPEPEPEAPHPAPDPDPFPDDEQEPGPVAP
jgi:hypothetical protein